jgi:hypothetical protein
VNHKLSRGLLAAALLAILAIGATALWKSQRPRPVAPSVTKAPAQQADPSANLQRMYEELQAEAAANAQRSAEERNEMMNQSFDMLEAEADAVLNAPLANSLE